MQPTEINNQPQNFEFSVSNVKMRSGSSQHDREYITWYCRQVVEKTLKARLKMEKVADLLDWDDNTAITCKTSCANIIAIHSKLADFVDFFKNVPELAALFTEAQAASKKDYEAIIKSYTEIAGWFNSVP